MSAQPRFADPTELQAIREHHAYECGRGSSNYQNDVGVLLQHIDALTNALHDATQEPEYALAAQVERGKVFQTIREIRQARERSGAWDDPYNSDPAMIALNAALDAVEALGPTAPLPPPEALAAENEWLRTALRQCAEALAHATDHPADGQGHSAWVALRQAEALLGEDIP